jgi:hypothetical protein
MPDEVVVTTPTPDLPPTDFAEYEKWHDRQVSGKPADTPALPVVKAAEKSKTAPNSGAEITQEDDEADDEAEEVAETPQKKSGFARRIDKLNQKIGERDATIAALKAAGTQGGDATRPAAIASEPKPAAAAVDGEPKPENFETYEAFMRSLTRWEIKQDNLSRENAAAEHQRVTTWKERIAAVKVELPDYDEVMSEAEEIRVSPAMHEAILTSEHGPALAYHLAKNPEEAARIFALSPIATARALGKIEASFDSEKVAPEKDKPRVTKAPPPAKTVRGARADSTSEPDPSDFSAWERWRNAQPGASLRR